jgi:hypothetical protein
LVLVTSFLICVSLASTKLEWYDTPLYPWLAMLTAIGLGWILSPLVGERLWWKQTVVLAFLFLGPYLVLFGRSQGNTIPAAEMRVEAIERYLFVRGPDDPNLAGVKIFYTGWNGGLLFYKYKFADSGTTIKLCSRLQGGRQGSSMQR